jgi:hypothetical protein
VVRVQHHLQQEEMAISPGVVELGCHARCRHPSGDVGA